MATVQDLSLYFRALADRKRLDIVEYLAAHDQITVTELGELLHLSQPLISWHLRKLRRVGVVKTHRTGRQVHCSLDRLVLDEYQERIAREFDLGHGERGVTDDPLELGRTAAS